MGRKIERMSSGEAVSFISRLRKIEEGFDKLSMELNDRVPVRLIDKTIKVSNNIGDLANYLEEHLP